MTRAGLTTIALAVALTVANEGARAFSNGAGTCDAGASLKPHPAFPSSGDGGFVFSAPAAYIPNADVTITLSGTAGFKGILLYAIDDTAERVGEWQNLAAAYHIKTGCGGDALATLTQTDGSVKGVPVALTWKAPPALTGTVTFESLVMTNFSTYFNVSGLRIAEAIFLDGFE